MPSVDVSGNFSDADGDSLTYTASTSDKAKATVSVSSSTVSITPVASGQRNDNGHGERWEFKRDTEHLCNGKRPSQPRPDRRRFNFRADSNGGRQRSNVRREQRFQRPR